MFQPSTTCLIIVIFESVGLKIKKKKAEMFLLQSIVSSLVFVCLFFVFVNFFICGFVISDDEQSKLESSSSSFDNYYPEIAKVIYIANSNSGYKVINMS